MGSGAANARRWENLATMIRRRRGGEIVHLLLLDQGNRKALVVLLIAVTLPPASRAGYATTQWGMPLTQVQQLYPDGEIAEGTPEGGVTYVIAGRVAGLRTVVVFSFVDEGRLFAVSELFPRRGSAVNLRTLDVPPPSNPEAAKIVGILRRFFTKRYGKPRRSDGAISLWVGSDDAVSLQVEKRDKVHTTVAVLYSGYVRK